MNILASMLVTFASVGCDVCLFPLSEAHSSAGIFAKLYTQLVTSTRKLRKNWLDFQDHCSSAAVASLAMGHWGMCSLDFQQFHS